jgi:hypothetical protein
MKNLLTIAIVLASVNVFATRASNTALGNSAHLTDRYSPEVIAADGEMFVLESGTTTTTTANAVLNKNAEGQLVKAVGPGFLSLGLGHLDPSILTLRNGVIANVPTIVNQQNPLEVAYGLKMDGMNIGGGLIYSNYNDKFNDVKESSMGLKFGLSTDLFYARAKVILADKYDTAALAYKGKPTFDLTGGMNFGSTSVHAMISSYGAKVTPVGGADTVDTEVMGIGVKAVDTIKSEGNDFFYGIGLTSVTAKEKVGDTKSSELNMPLIIGLEANALSWLKLRASVTQDVLLSNEKSENATATTSETNPGLNTTQFAAGAGIVYNKITVDGTLMTDATQQKLNSNDLLGTVGLTYKF